MTRINTIINSLGFNKKYTQDEVEFFDLLLDTDNEGFVNHDLIKKRALTCPVAKRMNDSIDSFLKNLFDYAHFKKGAQLNKLLSGLNETNQTSLGFSFAHPKGKSVGNVLKKTLEQQMQFLMESLRQGNFTINSLYFGLDNIGPDRTSDIIVSIIKAQLIEFTTQMVAKYNLPTRTFVVSNVYDKTTGEWSDQICQLPFYKSRAIILLPKFLISNKKFSSRVFRAFMSFAFEKYMKNNSSYSSFINNPDKGLTKKEWKEFLSENGIAEKEEFRKYIRKISNIINEFEIAYSDEIDFLSNDELKEIVMQAVNKLK